MAAPTKIPEVKSRGLVDLFFFFSFPNRELKKFLFCLGYARQPKKMLQVGFLPAICSFISWFLANETFARKFGLLLVVCTSRSTTWAALAWFTIFGAFVLAIRPWIVPFHLACILWVRIMLFLAENCIVPFSKLHGSIHWGCTLYPHLFSRALFQTLNISIQGFGARNIIALEQSFWKYCIITGYSTSLNAAH